MHLKKKWIRGAKKREWKLESIYHVKLDDDKSIICRSISSLCEIEQKSERAEWNASGKEKLKQIRRAPSNSYSITFELFGKL